MIGLRLVEGIQGFFNLNPKRDYFFIDSMIRSILVFGGPEKIFFKSSSEKFSFRNAMMSVLSFQQPMMFLHGSFSFREVQYVNLTSMPN